jgi:hypothetical protein
VTRLALLAALGLLLVGCGSDDSRGDADDEAQWERWVLAYKRQADDWTKAYQSLGQPLKQKDVEKVSEVLRETFLAKRPNVRARFADVPDSLADGRRLYQLLIRASDAGQEWALVYQTDPPPYGPGEFGKARRQANLALRFSARSTESTRRSICGAPSATASVPTDRRRVPDRWSIGRHILWLVMRQGVS